MTKTKIDVGTIVKLKKDVIPANESLKQDKEYFISELIPVHSISGELLYNAWRIGQDVYHPMLFDLVNGKVDKKSKKKEKVD